MPEATDDRPTVLVPMLMHFSARNVLHTPVLREMAARHDIRWVLISHLPADGDIVRGANADNLRHETATPSRVSPSFASFRGPTSRLACAVLDFDRRYLNPALCQRFHAINDLAVLRLRRRMSREQRRLELVYSNFTPRWKSEPFERARSVFTALYRLRSVLGRYASDPWVAHLFDVYRPTALLNMRHQFQPAWAYTCEAARRRVPSVGVIQSWDQPSTKGFTEPGANVYAVYSQQMRYHLERYHGTDPARIVNTGAPWLEGESNDADAIDGAVLRRELDLPQTARIVLLATNLQTMRAHEPSIAAALARAVEDDRFGADTALVIRTHPQDTAGLDDFGSLASPRVRIIAASGFGHYAKSGGGADVDGAHDLALYDALLRTSSVVINTRSSVTLDAIARDTPVINLGYDGDRDVAASDSVRVRYAFEFFAPLVEPLRCGEPASWLVGSERELFHAIETYMREPALHAAGRGEARQMHLSPAGQGNARRLVDLAAAAALNKLPEPMRTPDLAHTSLPRKGAGRPRLSDRPTVAMEAA
jgi:hypothetical protein